MDDLVKRLRFGSLTTMGSHRMNLEAAARIEALEAQVAAADALAREVERIATHKQKEMGLDYGRPHHPAYPELFRRLAVYEAKKGGA